MTKRLFRILIVLVPAVALAVLALLPKPPPVISRAIDTVREELSHLLPALPPPDTDTNTLWRERSVRRQAFQAGQLLPGAEALAEPLDARLSRAGFKLGQPIFLRIYKLSFELEVWIKRSATYELFATYPICTFSGRLGPKLKSLDGQSPEGLYHVTAQQLNPNSRFHRSFNLGFPNAYDRAHGRTGSFLMVHGACASVGCYAMTDAGADDLFTLARAALSAGQPHFQVLALPFRMTADALTRRAADPNAPFWTDLKTITDAFDTTRRPPAVSVCNGRYVLNDRSGAPEAANCRKI